MWLGRAILGQELPLGVQCVNTSNVATAPDSAPTMQIISEAGSVIVSKQIPPVDATNIVGAFQYRQPLGSSFSTGRYVVRYTYAISSTTYVAELDYFEIVGVGHTGGQIVSLGFIDRPEQNSDWLVAQTDAGQIGLLRGPRT